MFNTYIVVLIIWVYTNVQIHQTVSINWLRSKESAGADGGGVGAVGDTRDAGSIPGSGRSPGRPPEGGHGNPLQCSCLKNPMDGGAWQATVHWVQKNRA